MRHRQALVRGCQLLCQIHQQLSLLIRSRRLYSCRGEQQEAHPSRAKMVVQKTQIHILYTQLYLAAAASIRALSKASLFSKVNWIMPMARGAGKEQSELILDRCQLDNRSSPWSLLKQPGATDVVAKVIADRLLMNYMVCHFQRISTSDKVSHKSANSVLFGNTTFTCRFGYIALARSARS